MAHILPLGKTCRLLEIIPLCFKTSFLATIFIFKGNVTSSALWGRPQLDWMPPAMEPLSP